MTTYFVSRELTEMSFERTGPVRTNAVPKAGQRQGRCPGFGTTLAQDPLRNMVNVGK